MACRAFGPHNGKGLRESIGIFCALMGFKELEKRSGRFEKKRWISLVVVLCLLMQMLPVSAMASVQTAGKAPAAAATEPVDLIPDEPNTETPNYVCTWSFQDWAAYSDDYTPAMDSNIPRDMLNHEQLFGENGWVNTAYQDSKQDLIFLLDDGWDLPKGGNGSYFGSFLVSPDKFPDYGDTPQDHG